MPEKNIAACRKLARRRAAKIWLEHGALHYVECREDEAGPVDLVPPGVEAQVRELVFFSWIVYKPRRDRDRVLKKVMADPCLRKGRAPKTMPFDGKRMIWSGFKPVVELQ